jgi:hypothetical protein
MAHLARKRRDLEEGTYLLAGLGRAKSIFPLPSVRTGMQSPLFVALEVVRSRGADMGLSCKLG